MKFRKMNLVRKTKKYKAPSFEIKIVKWKFLSSRNTQRINVYNCYYSLRSPIFYIPAPYAFYRSSEITFKFRDLACTCLKLNE